MYAVITENDESAWKDVTGVLYHFPKKYLEILTPGTKVIYYKGRIKNSIYKKKRLSNQMHYFGTAEIESLYLDPNSKKRDYFASLIDYKYFTKPIMSKLANGYLETIPKNKVKNYWRDGVRKISRTTYDLILESIDDKAVIKTSPVEKSYDDLLESYSETEFIEGKKIHKFVTHYERNSRLRKIAIALHGDTCFGCGFNFGMFYGPTGKGFIHVHHLKPVSTVGKDNTVDPNTDLIPLCANCHSIIHRNKNNTMSLIELRAAISSNGKFKPIKGAIENG